ncbi:MAG: FtsX-like permease family protein [Clostridia bacterium]|nr:FtsX-like permease family protein [Clostridia bacterium]
MNERTKILYLYESLIGKSMGLQFKIIRKKYLKILISMVIIISLGVALLFGLMNGVLSLRKSVDKFIKENNYPDIKILTNLEDIDKISDLKKEKFKSIEYRLAINTIINKDSQIFSVKAITYEDKDLKDFYINEEKDNNSGYYDVLVEKRFANDNNIKLGDTLKLKMGEENYEFCVSKIISVPETIGNVPINGMWVRINDYGNVYINKKVLYEDTNQKKRDLLSEIEKKEEELQNEENNRLDEYNNAKNKIKKSLNEYNLKKNESTQKKEELNQNKEKLLELKKEYIETTDSLNKIENKVYSYINSYEKLSDNAKNYIDKLIESKYPDLKIEDLEFATDIAYSIFENNLNKLFDPDNEINKKLKNKIMMADIIKLMTEAYYDYLNSDEVEDLINKIKEGQDVTETSEYNELKSRLNIIDIVTDDNIVDVYEVAKVALNEIHKVSKKLPFNSFSELYNFVDSSRALLPLIYDSYKGKLQPYFEEIVNTNDSIKQRIKNEIDSIYNSNKSLTEKARIITNKVFDYVQDLVNETVVSELSEYTDDTTGGPLDIIKRLLGEIDEGIDKIDEGLKTAYSLINKKEEDLEKARKAFEGKILEAKQELNNRRAEVENIKGLESKFNEILINVDDASDKEAVLKNVIDKYLKDIEVLDSYTYEKSPMYNYVKVNIDVMDKLSTIVPIVFYIIILIILFLFVSLMIKQGKKEIAILRLLGKTTSRIRLGFCINNLIVAIVGLILGFLIGLFPMIYMVEYFKNFFLLPNVVYIVNGLSIILSIIATIIVVEIATIIATFELDKITPVEILKNEEYQNRKTLKITKWITSKFKPFKKFSILVYIRNKSKLILGIICTSATVALIFSSLAYIASKNKIFNNYFDDRIHYSAQIFKSGTITDEEVDELRNLDYVENADLLRYFNVKLKNNNKEQDIVINALDNKNKYISIYDKDNNEIAYPESGIVLEEHIANDLGLKLNDEVDINGVKFKIVDISFQSLGRVNFISLDDSYKLKSSFDTIVLNMDNDKKDELINKESSKNNYVYTVFNNEIREYNKEIFDSYTIPAVIIIVFALIIGYIIIININSYNLLDQKKNLSIFRSLGFSYSEISKSWFVQALIQWITSIIIGIPSGILLSKYILKYVSSIRREFVYASGIKEIIFTVILLFLYIYIGHRKCMKNFRKIDIIEEVKDKE